MPYFCHIPLVWLAVFVNERSAGQKQIDIRIVALVFRDSITNLEINRWLVATIDQVMTVIFSGGKSSRHPGAESLLTRIRDQ